ncbi:YlbF family regulator [Evansella cellulosilytica]|uniref:YlbF family regulator n=1 Tax=Evansella cellulosilytica (strain ATCC 21833 / DSM 2522 / FERM P-1141 / JCM 9156 / N-4) TaxID=649639 RepID=E6TUI5_EVAC2|nr:YlbF family regulator [Evansella cellulosilytica]ADU30875.1 hypothetical protein Bcell_2618 [Evansella cellulosilytica DSM 2522]
MYSTMTNVDILQEVYDFSDFITSSEVFLHYIETKRALEKNRDAQRMITHFQALKEKYEEVQRFGKYHPDFDKVTKEVREWKRKVDTNLFVSEFKKAEEELNQLLVEISQIVANAVSTHIKVPTGNPFFDQGGCGTGGCGSGGGCGCSTKKK